MADELKENLEQETKPSKKRSKLFWALLASGIGAVIIAVVLLVVFLMPKEEKFDINLGSSGTTSSVVLTGDGSYTKGDSVTIVAQDIEGYRFVNWTYNGNIVSEEREYTFVIGESTQGEYTANYARVYKIKASENQYGTFTINPTSAIAGEEITVEFEIGAEYQDEYTFSDLYYMYNTTENIIENNRFIMPEGDVKIYARLDNLYNINLTSNISDSVEVDLIGEGLYAENASATITAPYVEGYRFRSWTYRGEVVSNSPTYIIENVNENTSGTYIANYDSPFSVTINMPSGTLNKTAFVNDEMSFNCVLEDIITDKEIIKQKIQILAEGEELPYTEENGQFSFIMPASNVEINIIEDSKLSRITDFIIKNNRIFSYTGPAKEVTVPSSYYPYQQETGNILRFKTQQEYLNTIMNDYGFMYLFSGGHFSYKTNNSAEVVYVETAEDGVLWFENTMSYTEDHFPLEITLPTEYTVTLEDIKGITEAEMAILSPIAVIFMSNNCLLSFTCQIGDAEPINVDINNSEDLFTILENTLGDNFDPKEVLPIKYSNFKYGKTIPCVGDGVKIERLGALDVDNSEIVFSGNTNITKVIVPEGITIIGDNAFSGCTSLTEVSLPTTLTSIEGNAFSGCTKLTSITIPKRVKEIGYSAFNNCTSLNTINFEPNSQLQTIGSSAFSGCTNLSTITIPDTVIEVGQDAFSGTKLTYMEDNNGRYLASATNQYCILIDVVDTNVTELTVSENCRIIANPFYNLNSLKKVTIPSSVVHIANTFSCDIYYQGSLEQWVDISYGSYGYNTSSNTSLYINNQKVEEIVINKDIKRGAFSGIASIKKVTLGTNVTSIGSSAFSGCINLTDVYYQGTLDQWLKISFDGEWASYTNINLYIEDELIEELTINKNIKDYAFNSVASLKKVTLGEDVTSIGYYAFSNCQNLTDIYYQGTLAQWLDMRFSGDQGWQNCNLYINNILVEEVNINRNIKGHAFSGFTSIKKVTLGEDVTSIGSYAFQNCTNLQTVDFGSNSQLQTIGDYAFEYCTNLTSIIIPENVTSIDYSAFYKCYSLAIVYNNSSLSISLGSSDNGHVGYYAYEIVDKEDTAKGKIEEINGIQYYINDVTQEFVAFAVATDRDAVVSATIDSRAKNLNQNIFINCNNLKEIIFEDNSQLQTIGSYVFQYCTSLQTVDFGDNSQLQTIGDWAFYNCTNLTSITIPSSVISIGNSAFLGTNLQTITFEDGSQFQSIDGFIPSSIKHIIFEGNSSLISISDGTFSSSVNLQTIDFGDNSQLQTIGNSAFYGCSSLTTVDFGNNSKLQSIGSYAFQNCTSLSSITIPAGVTSIGEYAFYNCKSLSSITIPAGVTTLDNSTFDGCASLQTMKFADDSQLQSIDSGLIPSSIVSIIFEGNSSLTSIGDSAFSGCTNLTTIDFGTKSQLQSIGSSAFSGCTSLSSITIPSGVTIIGDYAFSGCTSLTSITIPASVTTVGSAFSGSYLQTITFADNSQLQTIGYNAFQNCTNLTTIDFGNNSKLQSIGSYAFLDCTSLSSITIPAGVTSIGEYAFYNCKSLSSITIPAGVTTLNYSTFFGCTGLQTMTFADGSKLQSIDNGLIPTSIVSIIFEGNSSLASIGNYAFSGCSNLTTVDFGENSSLQSIGEYAFYNCKSLSSITIPAGVTTLDNSTFDGCTSLQTMKFADGSQLQSIDSGLIPSSIVSIIFEGNSSLASIGNSAFRDCASMTTIDFGTNSQLQSIGSFAFSGCTSLSSITIPAGVKSIGDSAFSGCTSLQTMKFADGSQLQSIGSYAFSGCTSLSSITIPETVTSIGDSAFNGCTSLQTMKFADGSQLQSIGKYAFQNCTSLSSITIPASVTSIGRDAFNGCYLLSIVYNNSSLEINEGDSGNGWVGYYACEVVNPGESVQGRIEERNGVYYYINNETGEFVAASPVQDRGTLTSITLNLSTTAIKNGAFGNCSSLSSITIPETVTSIGDNAFNGCYSLAIVVNNSSKITITKGYYGNGRVGYYAYEVVNVNAGESVQGSIKEINNVQYYINDRTQEKVALSAIDRSVSSISLEKDTTSINQYAFSECRNLISINIPSEVTIIGDSAFQNCTNLTTINFGTNSQLQSIGSYAFSGCTSLSSITIPSKCDTIGDSAFHNCTNLTTINFGTNSQLQSIDSYAFSGCTSLSSITIPAGVTTINNYVFYNCTSLSSITIPANVKTISDNAFENCTSLTIVTIESDKVYNAAVGVESNHAGGLLANAETVYVLKTIVDNEANSNEYLTSNFTRSESGDGLYYIYTKSNTAT